MSFKKQFLKNVFVTAGFNYVAQGITFLSTIITSRLLLPKSFGLVGLITVFSGFITMLSDSGLSYAVIRTKYRDTYYRSLFSLSIIFGIVLCLATGLLIYPISLFYKNSAIVAPGLAIAILFIPKSMTIVPTALLQKRLSFSFLGLATLISVGINVLTTIIFAYLGFQHWSLILPQFLASITLFLIIKKEVPIKLTFKKKNIAKTFTITKSLISKILGFNVINYWARNADNLLVGKMYGMSDLGLYNRAYQVLTISLTLITGIFSSVLYPSLGKIKQVDGDVQEHYYFSLKMISILNVPVAFIVILIPHLLVQFLWGKNWLTVSIFLPYFGLLILTQTLLSTVGSILVLEGKEKEFMISGWVGAIFIVSGIVVGAFFSLEKIAAFYSLAFIVFVLPFNVVYAYAYALKQPLRLMASFWIPKILLSLTIWVGLFFKIPNIVMFGLALWVVHILVDSGSDLKKLGNVIRANISRRSAVNI